MMLAHRTISCVAFLRTIAAQRIDWLSAAEAEHWAALTRSNSISGCGIEWLDCRSACKKGPEANYEQQLISRSGLNGTAWLAARWLAKSLASEVYGWQGAWNRLHIESRNGLASGCPPRFFVDGRMVDWSVSLSHYEGRALAVAGGHGWQLGCDLISNVGRAARVSANSGFARLWLGEAEREALAAEPTAATLTLLWGLKETCYKAFGQGRPFVPRKWDSLTWLAALGIAPPRLQQGFEPDGWRAKAPGAMLSIEASPASGQLAIVLAAAPQATYAVLASELCEAA